MTNQERLQENNEKIEAIQEALADKTAGGNTDASTLKITVSNNISGLDSESGRLEGNTVNPSTVKTYNPNDEDVTIPAVTGSLDGGLLASAHNILVDRVDTNTTDIENITTSLNEVIDTVNNLPTGGKIAVATLTGNLSNIARSLIAYGDKLIKIVIHPSSTNHVLASGVTITLPDNTATTKNTYVFSNGVPVCFTPGLYSDTSYCFVGCGREGTGTYHLDFGISGVYVRCFNHKVNTTDNKITLECTYTSVSNAYISKIDVYYYE